MELNKQSVLIDYISKLVKDEYLVKPEYSTDYRDRQVIVVQEQDGEKVVFFGNVDPMNDFFEINIFATTIRKAKDTAILLGNLIGKSIYLDYVVKENDKTYTDKWKIIFKQYSNPQTINYQDIRRVSYALTLQCIISKVYREEN